MTLFLIYDLHVTNNQFFVSKDIHLTRNVNAKLSDPPETATQVFYLNSFMKFFF